MGHVFSGAFPILPGKSDRVRNFERELAPHRKDWDRLSRAGTFGFYNVTLQSSPQGDVAIYSFEVADPTRAPRGVGPPAPRRRSRTSLTRASRAAPRVVISGS